MDSGGRSEHTLNFVDVRVFNPFAPSNAAGSLSACYKKHETQRREHIDEGFEKLSILHLLLWLCQPSVDWLMRQHIL